MASFGIAPWLVVFSIFKARFITNFHVENFKTLHRNDENAGKTRKKRNTFSENTRNAFFPPKKKKEVVFRVRKISQILAPA